MTQPTREDHRRRAQENRQFTLNFLAVVAAGSHVLGAALTAPGQRPATVRRQPSQRWYLRTGEAPDWLF